MRSLTIVVVALALAWGAWWFYSSAREEAAVTAWFDSRSGADHASIKTAGFPNRLDTSIQAPSLDVGPFVWSLPLLQLMRFSYAPGQYTLAFDSPQTLTFGMQEVTLHTGAARASVVYEKDELDRLALTAETPDFASDLGWSLTASRLLFAIRRKDGGYEVGLDALSLGHGADVTDIHAQGILTLSDGVPSGTLRITATDASALLRIAEAAGLPKAVAPLTLDFKDGGVFLNGAEIGLAPRLP